ncbi:SWI SNF complex component SNF12-like protein [Chlorella sorokiniana]|uniref:SWI SNF complex component SNF12-like protein n=1 Tax=Chlorella sorokiniana TaxID=3076 RepID=A0A2P6TYQ3_CHLSO|nr:SWI SNF complex component SNF12-like protein [Chlorella sorokiniana]|eukprot:PRW59194.1 SWI SNF complex component SNF12-like protein [Chlorella sorokiniana]
MAMAAAQGGGAAAAAKPAAAAAKPAATAAPAAAAATPAVQAVQAIPARKPGAGKKRKTDARLAERGDLLIPDSQLFTQLQDAERRVDMLISRKKHELQEMYASFRRGPPGSAQAAGSSRKKLRMYIRSEHYHQQNAADAAEPPSWTLLINGRLLGKASEAEEGHHHKHHFTHYLRRVEIQLDPAQYPGDSGFVQWDKARHEREQREAITMSRLGSAPVEATIKIELDHQPSQWRLSHALAGALGLKGHHSVPFVMQMLWGYIKAKQLYEPSDKGSVSIRCDGPLRDVFQADTVELSRMSDALKPHLSPAEPITLRYTIHPDGPPSAHPDCYDFEVEVPLSTELPPYALKAVALKEAEQHDAALASILTRLAEHRRRRTLLLAFAQSPVDFIHAMAAAQARELRSSAARDGEAFELMPSGDVFKDRWVDDVVMNYMERLQRKAQAAQAEQQQLAAAAAAQQLQAQAAMATLQAQQAALAQQQQQQQIQAQAMAAQQAAIAAAHAQQQAAAAAAAGGAAAPGAAAVGPPGAVGMPGAAQPQPQLQQAGQVQAPSNP